MDCRFSTIAPSFPDACNVNRNDSEEELAIFDSILSQRPDIADAMADEATQS